VTNGLVHPLSRPARWKTSCWGIFTADSESRPTWVHSRPTIPTAAGNRSPCVAGWGGNKPSAPIVRSAAPTPIRVHPGSAATGCRFGPPAVILTVRPDGGPGCADGPNQPGGCTSAACASRERLAVSVAESNGVRGGRAHRPGLLRLTREWSDSRPTPCTPANRHSALTIGGARDFVPLLRRSRPTPSVQSCRPSFRPTPRVPSPPPASVLRRTVPHPESGPGRRDSLVHQSPVATIGRHPQPSPPRGLGQLSPSPARGHSAGVRPSLFCHRRSFPRPR